jgi:hypothetical protein
MWIIDRLRQRKYHRRYKAALVVLLGTYMMEELDPKDRKRVEAEVDRNFERSNTPAVAWRRVLPVTDAAALGAFRAAAMDRLGIPPMAAMSWAELFKPWSRWRIRTLWPDLRGFDMAPVNVMTDFRPMDRATADARSFLRQCGMSIPDFDSWDTYSYPRQAQYAPVHAPNSSSSGRAEARRST